MRRHHRSPAQAMEPAGRDPGRAFGAPRSGTTDAPFPEEVQSFPDNFSARLRPGPWTMPEVERRPGNYLGDYPSPHHLTASAASRPNLSIASGQALLQAAQAVWLIRRAVRLAHGSGTAAGPAARRRGPAGGSDGTPPVRAVRFDRIRQKECSSAHHVVAAVTAATFPNRLFLANVTMPPKLLDSGADDRPNEASVTSNGFASSSLR